MTWLQILAQGGIIATFLGVGIAVAAYFNGKHIKEGVRETQETLGRLDKLLEQIANMAENIAKRTESIANMAENTAKITENIAKMYQEGTREFRELLERMDRRADERHTEVVGLMERLARG